MKALLEMPVFPRHVGSCSVPYKLNMSLLQEPTSWNLKKNFRKYFHKCDFEALWKGKFSTKDAVLLQCTVKQILINPSCFYVLIMMMMMMTEIHSAFINLKA